MDRVLFKAAVHYKKIKLYATEKALILYDGSTRMEITYDYGRDTYIVSDGKDQLHDIYNDQLGSMVKERFKRWF